MPPYLQILADDSGAGQDDFARFDAIASTVYQTARRSLRLNGTVSTDSTRRA
jgi:hypothetical protein